MSLDVTAFTLTTTEELWSSDTVTMRFLLTSQNETLLPQRLTLDGRPALRRSGGSQLLPLMDDETTVLIGTFKAAGLFLACAVTCTLTELTQLNGPQVDSSLAAEPSPEGGTWSRCPLTVEFLAEQINWTFLKDISALIQEACSVLNELVDPRVLYWVTECG